MKAPVPVWHGNLWTRDLPGYTLSKGDGTNGSGQNIPQNTSSQCPDFLSTIINPYLQPYSRNNTIVVEVKGGWAV